MQIYGEWQILIPAGSYQLISKTVKCIQNKSIINPNKTAPIIRGITCQSTQSSLNVTQFIPIRCKLMPPGLPPCLCFTMNLSWPTVADDHKTYSGKLRVCRTFTLPRVPMDHFIDSFQEIWEAALVFSVFRQGNSEKLRKVSTEWEKIVVGHISDKSLVSRIYKEARKLNHKMIGSAIKEWAKDLNGCFSKEDIQMANIQTKRCSTSLAIRKQT